MIDNLFYFVFFPEEFNLSVLPLFVQRFPRQMWHAEPFSFHREDKMALYPVRKSVFPYE